MIWFFRYCYYGVYEFNKRKGWERPDEKAFVWMASSRGIMYILAMIVISNHYNFANIQINRFWGAIALTIIELTVSTLLNGKKKHALIEERFSRFPQKLQTFYTCIGLLFFPVCVISLFSLIFIYKD